MNCTHLTPTFLLAAITGFAVTAGSSEAGEISISTTAPSIDGDDIANYATPTATQKWFDDIEHDAGQTFTPTTDGLLRSFTVYLQNGNLNDAGTENVDLRFGTISRPDGEFTFTETYSENAAMAPSPEGDWAAGDYITFIFDTPQEIRAGVEYGIITDAQNMGSWRDGGIPYRHRTGNDYDGGVMINRGGEIAGSDLVFHIDIGGSTDSDDFEITAIDYSPGDDTLTLTWTSEPDKIYAVKYSRDLGDWGSDLDDGVEADEGPTTTEEFDLTEAGLQDEGRLYFRVEEVD